MGALLMKANSTHLARVRNSCVCNLMKSNSSPSGSGNGGGGFDNAIDSTKPMTVVDAVAETSKNCTDRLDAKIRLSSNFCLLQYFETATSDVCDPPDVW